MKKLLSILLTITLLATLLPTVFVSAAGEETLNFPITEDASITFSNNYMGIKPSYGAYSGGEDSSYYLRTVAGTTSKEYAVHKAALTGLSAALGTTKAVTKVEFCTYIVGERIDDNRDGSYSMSNTMNIYPAYSGWSESTITYNTWKNEAYSPVITNPGSDYGIIDSSVTPATTSYSFPAVAYDGTPQAATFDVTSAFNKALASGIKADSEFAFLTALGELTTYGYVIFASSEYTNASYRPYIKVTLGDIPPLKMESKTDPVNPSDNFELIFSNNISAATVKVNGSNVSEADIDIFGTDVTFDYSYAPFTTYDVDVEVTDSFGQKFAKAYNFTTSNEVVSGTLALNGMYQTKHTGTASVTKGYGYTYTDDPAGTNYNSNTLILWDISIPASIGGTVESYTLDFELDYPTNTDNSSRMRLYEGTVPTGKAITEVVWSDIKDCRSDGTRLADLTYNGGSAYTLDITDYANRAYKNGISSIYVIADSLVGGSTNYKKPTASYSINSNPTLDISAKDIVLSGTTLTKAGFSLNTTLPASFAQSVELVDENDLKVDSAAFSCDGSDVEIDSAITLTPDTAYSLVIRAGAADTNGNEFTSDFVVQSFVTTTSPVLDSEADGRHELYTDNTNQTVEYLYINPDFGGMKYDVTITEHAGGSQVYSKQIKSTLGGKIEEIVALSSGEYDISIIPMGAQEGWTKVFRLFDEATLNSLWSIMTSSNSSAIESNWAVLTDAFGISKSADTALTALCNVLSANAKSFGERNNANLGKFKAHLANCEILAQLNQSKLASVGEAKLLLEASFPQVEAADSAAHAAVSADWSELGTKITKEYQKTADEVFTASAEAAKLLICIDTVKRADTLDKLNALNHTSLIYDFVTSDGNAHYLGITDLVDDYKSLSSTSSVDSAVQGKGFATAGEFRTAFSAAIDLAKLETPPTPPVQKPSYSSGGGGGGSFGVISATPSAIPETGVPETGVALPFADVANHTWAHSAIATLHSKGIIAGRGDGSFAPDDKVTRAEFAKMLVLALGIQAKETDIIFADVASTDWFASYALTAAANGIVLGSGGSFLPNASITRQDAAVMIYRALAFAGGTMPAFTDSDSIASYARDAIASLCTAGILKGMEDGSFAPLSSLTRAQAAVMLSRIMEV